MRTFNGLFEPTNTPEENRLLAEALESGNRLSNLVNTPEEAHIRKGVGIPVHSLMKQRGLEHAAAREKWHPLLQELDDAAGTSIRHKLHLVDRYNKELRPLVNKAYDDAMTSYYEPTPKAQLEAKARVKARLEEIELKKAQNQMQTTATLMPGD